MEVPQKSKNKLPYDLVIPLLGVYTDKTLIQKDICTFMLTAALFTRDKSEYNQNTHPLIEKTVA